MLKHLQTHEEYLNIQNQLHGSVTQEALEEYGDLIAIFQLLNFDNSHKYLATLYSSTGRPALNQIEIFRSMVLCAYLDISWERLIYFLHHRAVFRTIIGVSKETIAPLRSFYALSSRIMPTHEKIVTRKPVGRKPTHKLKRTKRWLRKKRDVCKT